MNNKIIITILLLFSFVIVYGRIQIHPGAKANLADDAELNISGDWVNNGTFSSGTGKLNFVYTGTFSGSAANYFYNVLIDADYILDSEVHITGNLYLKSGVLDSALRRNMDLQKKTERKRRTPTSRTGSLFLENDVTLIRYYGSLAFSPNVSSRLNLMYLGSLTTGLEVPESSSVIQKVTVYAPAETVTLGNNITVNDTLRVLSGSINTSSYNLNITASAVIDAFPSNITGNLIGESVAVGTSSYTNADHGFQVSAGNDIGNIRSLLFIKPVSLGSTEGISGSWRIESDTDPVGRDLTLYWPSESDNDVNNLNIQAWKSIDEGSNWFHTRTATSSTTDPRSIVIDDIASFSDWTVAEPHFSFDVDELDFDVIGVGNSAVMQFTLTNDRPETISGTVAAPSGFSVAEVMGRNRTNNSVSEISVIPPLTRSKKKGKEKSSASSVHSQPNPLTRRNTIMFSVPASSSIDFEVTFSPGSNVSYEDYLVVQESGAGNPGRILSVIGTGINLPDIDASPLYFSDVLAEGETSVDNLTVSNSGDLDLVYSASILYTTGVRDALVVSPQRADYYTGTCTSVEKTETSETLNRGGSSTTQESGWMKFDVSTIPDAAVITSVHLRCYSTDTNYPYWSITPVTNDPVGADAATLNADIKAEGDVGYYVRIQTNDTVLGWKDYELLGTANTDLQTALTQNWFAIGLPSRDASPTYFIDFDGWNELHPPYLEVEYTLTQSESWITLDSGTSVSGTVTNGTPADISVGMDATGMDDGNYSAVILLTSNDLSEPDVNISVNLTVGEPIINVSVSELDFGDVELGLFETMQFDIENTGSLTLSGNITTPDGFSVIQAARTNLLSSNSKHKSKTKDVQRNVLSYSLEPELTQTFDVTFIPTTATDYDENIVITHNAAGADELINVLGTGTAPDITYNPDNFTQTLAPEATASQSLNIGNAGNSNLDYNISFTHTVRNVLTSEKDPVVIYDPYDYHAPTRQGGEDEASAMLISALPFNDTGTTTGYLNDYDEVCPYGGSTAPDVVYVYTPMADVTVDISLCNGSTYDTKLYVYENSVTPGNTFACNDDGTGCPNYTSEILDLLLTGGNDYYIVIDGYGGASGDYVLEISEDVVTSEYCQTNYTNLTDDYITNVALNTIDNSSGSGGYEDYTAISTDLVRGDTYDIFVDIFVNGPSWTQHCKAWVDWNQDFIFDPLTEAFDFGQTTGTGQLTTSVYVPYDAVLGSTRMRIAEMYNADPEPCTIYSFGEAEDYTINVSELITDNWLALDGATYVNGTVNPNTGDNVISVDFDAAGLPEGIYTANLNLTSNDADEPYVYIPVQLIVQDPPVIFVSETSLSFGNIEVGTSDVLQFYIENTGSGTLEGDITTPSGFSVSGQVVIMMRDNGQKIITISNELTTKENAFRNVLAYSVPAGNLVYYDLTFAPVEAITYTENVEISHNAAGGNKQIAVSGAGIVADIDVTPLSFDKLLFTNDVTNSDTLFISNTGLADLNCNISITYNEPVPNWLSLDGQQTIMGSISPSVPAHLVVGFDAALGEGIYTADIEIASNDPDEPLVTVPVSLEVLTGLDSPANVTIITAQNGNDVDVTISWSAAYAATSYTVYRTHSPYKIFPEEWIAVTDITETSWSYTTNREKRFYRVTANRD